MKYTIALLTAVVMMAAVSLTASAQSGKKQSLETVVYSVNIHCDNCKAKLRKHIPFEKGVKDMEVDLEEKTVTVKFDQKKNTVEGIAKAIEDLGYICEVVPQDNNG